MGPASARDFTSEWPGRGLRFDPEWPLLPLFESIGLGAVERVKIKKGKDTTFPFS
jgi:hypothetical protein